MVVLPETAVAQGRAVQHAQEYTGLGLVLHLILPLCVKKLLVIELLLFLSHPHPFLMMAGGSDWGTVVGIDFSFPVCKNTWKSGRRKRSEEKLEKSQREGVGCRPYAAEGRYGRTRVLLSQGNYECAWRQESEEGCGYPELKPRIPPANASPQWLPGGSNFLAEIFLVTLEQGASSPRTCLSALMVLK